MPPADSTSVRDEDYGHSAFVELSEHLQRTSAPERIQQILASLRELLSARDQVLVFRNRIEPVEEEMARGRVVLAKQTDYWIEGQSRVSHTLIEGENLAALRFLNDEYRQGIDVVCIDPPYNTGMCGLTYSDHLLVDPGAPYPHSNWLSFMRKRLDIAHDLLSDTGVLFVNIDEHEIANLILLCDRIFGEGNTDVLIWPKTDPIHDENRVERPYHNIKIVHEYVIVCFKDKARTKLNQMRMPTWADGGYSETPRDMETILKGLGTTSSAKDELAEVFGDRLAFQTPKPRKLIKELVRSASHRKSIVLDCFAGSGTTAIAVSDLNQEDGGERKCILITDNENDICRKITYQRLKITRERERFREGLEYYIVEIRP